MYKADWNSNRILAAPFLFLAVVAGTMADAKEESCHLTANPVVLQKTFAGKCESKGDATFMGAIKDPSVMLWRGMKADWYAKRFPAVDKSLSDLSDKISKLAEFPPDDTFVGGYLDTLSKIHFKIWDIQKQMNALRKDYATNYDSLTRLEKSLNELNQNILALPAQRQKAVARWVTEHYKKSLEERVKVPDNMYYRYMKLAGVSDDHILASLEEEPRAAALHEAFNENLKGSIQGLRGFEIGMKQILDCRGILTQIREAQAERSVCETKQDPERSSETDKILVLAPGEPETPCDDQMATCYRAAASGANQH